MPCIGFGPCRYGKDDNQVVHAWSRLGFAFQGCEPNLLGTVFLAVRMAEQSAPGPPTVTRPRRNDKAGVGLLLCLAMDRKD